MEKREWELDTMALLMALKKSWKWILGAALLCMLVAVVATALAKPAYRMDVTFHVDNYGTKEGFSSSDLSASRDLAESCVVIAQMDSFLDAVVQQTGIDLTAAQLRKMIRCVQLNGTEFLQVQVTASDPQQAQQVAQAVARVLPGKAGEILKGAEVTVVDETAQPRLCSRDYGSRGALAFLLGIVLSAVAVTADYVCRVKKQK